MDQGLPGGFVPAPGPEQQLRIQAGQGPQAAAELKEGERALELLCCTGEIRSYPAEWGERSVIILTKQKHTAKVYPRKAGTVDKKPL